MITGTPLWNVHGAKVAELPRSAAVTVDVFQLKERSGKMYYYQWAVVPFEASYPMKGVKPNPAGIATIFFEGWSDELVPGSEGPLNNLQWETRVLEGNLHKLHSILQVPKRTSGK